MTEGATEPTILIIRRRGFEETDKPHSGVWKIAYADFMTAMMAFFLVMWLINATSESTRTGVANYFNPIKLSEGTQLPKKGLIHPEKAQSGASDPAGQEDPGPTPDPENRHPAKNGVEPPSATSEEAAGFSGQALFRDPYAVLAAISTKPDSTDAVEALGPVQSSEGRPVWSGERPYRDPYYPPGRAGSPHPDPRASTPPGKEAEPGGATAGAAGPPTQPSAQARRNGSAPGNMPAGTGRTSMTANASPGTGNAGNGAREAAADDPASAETQAERLLRRLMAGTADHPMPDINVTSGDEGMLISLSDQVDFGMFAIGSARPLPQTIAIMAKIATLLKEMKGQVIIRGHTDARPFRTDSSDNWRLSAARAYMAYQMLIRGGLDTARIIRLEAHADRDLKLPDDPEAAGNRRIEILVRKATP